MALSFLTRLIELSLPYQTTNATEILWIDTLNAASLVKADIPEFDRGEFNGPAVVNAITITGREVARSMMRNRTGRLAESAS